MALDGQAYGLSYTPGLLNNFYRRKRPDGTIEYLLPNKQEMLGTQGGYVDLNQDGHWWAPSGRSFFHPSNTASSAQELAEGRAHFFTGRRYEDEFGNTSFVDMDKHQAMPVKITDAVGNVTSCVNDYRVMQPLIVTDANDNRTTVAFDAVGNVTGSAVMGKTSENLGDSLDGFNPNVTDADLLTLFADPRGRKARELLGNASMRIVADEMRYSRNPDAPLPTRSVTIVREDHVSSGLPPNDVKIRVALTYSDGFGRQIQGKYMAEPGLVGDSPLVVAQRWVSSGWVSSGWALYDNKGHVVRQYEPFFDDTHEFKPNVKVGVSSIVYYDPISRPIATLAADHTWTKHVYEPWRQRIYDPIDVVLQHDPRSDPDVGDFFARLPQNEFLPTWYDARSNGLMGNDEKTYAEKCALHHDTPTVIHADALGHSFLTVKDNGSRGEYEERAVVDIEGNRLESIDARGRTVVMHQHNVSEQSIYHKTMDSGEHWMLYDVHGEPFLTWDSKGCRVRKTYDALHRPLDQFLQQPGSSVEIISDRAEYGESVAQAKSLNLRGRAFKAFDQAVVFTQTAFDFKGNVIGQETRLVRKFKEPIDWSAGSVDLEPETFTQHSDYDALNRPTRVIMQDGSIVRQVYNEANLLQKHLVCVRGETDANGQLEFTPFITNVEYDAQTRRTSVEFGNGTKTLNDFDTISPGLKRTRTIRAGATLQDLLFVYDPLDNIVKIADQAQQTHFFQNTVVNPGAEYTYDAIGRLISASGREHLSAAGAPNISDQMDSGNVGLENLGANAMGTYLETYTYDSVNNIQLVQHQGSNSNAPGWSRQYSYSEPSQIKPNVTGDRLSQTQVSSAIGNYRYDGAAGIQGSMTAMPGLTKLDCDYRDQLKATSTQIVSSGTPETTYYVYDGRGTRLRKITERAAAEGETPRRLKETIYLSGVEVYRKYAGDGSTVTLEKQTLEVTDGKRRVALVDNNLIGSDKSPPRLIRYQYGNQIRSASLEIDDQGQVVSYEEYTPFGSSSYQAFKKDIEADKRYRYAGQERDKETGLYYCSARYYAGWLGRWISSDPLGTHDGMNVYCYVRCNPIKFQDSGGTDAAQPYDWKNDPSAPLSYWDRAKLWAGEKKDNYLDAHRIIKGAVKDLDKRGEGLVNLPGNIVELSKKDPGEIVEALGNGVKTFAVNTVEGLKDTAYYGYKAATVGDAESLEKFGEAAMTSLLNVADVGTLASGLGGAKGAVKGLTKVVTKSVPKSLVKATTVAVETGTKAFAKGGKIVVETLKDVKATMLPPINEGFALAGAGGVAVDGIRVADAAENGAGALARAKAPESLGPSVGNKVAGYRSAGSASDIKRAATPIPPKSTWAGAIAATGGEVVDASGKVLTELHHIFPQAMKAFFKSRGINIHEFTIEISQRAHDVIHGMKGVGGEFLFEDMLTVWAKKLATKNLANLKAPELFKMADEVLDYYDKGLKKLPKVPYRR